MSNPSRIPPAVTIFSLAMINVAAVGTVKNWPITAEYGFSSIFFLILAALVFFLPVSLVSAELGSALPKKGGVFVWVKEAFGHRTGFLAIWLLWVQTVIWYPTALSFIAATIAYVFNPSLVDKPVYLISFMLILLWAATLANLLGMRISAWISTLGVVLGTFIPGLIIISLGVLWYLNGHPLEIDLSWRSLIPTMSKPEDLVFFSGIILTLAGMEMAAVHARDVKNPQKNYPRAVLLSVIIILGLSILGVLSIAIVVPQSQISLVAGSLQAFSYLVKAYNLDWLIPYIASLIALGAAGSLSTWIVGPTKGLLAAAQQGDLPPFFRKVNKKGMPTAFLIFQATLTSVLSLLFIFMPSINSAFWILSVLVTQLYLVMYFLMFGAAIKLRYCKPKMERPYQIPGGKIGIWSIGLLGICSCFFTLVLGFFPPSQFKTGNVVFYVGFLIVGMLLLCFAPYFILRFQKPNWKRALAHETEEE